MAAVVVAGAVTVAACAIAAVLALTSSSSSCDEAPAPMDATVAEAASPATSRECAVCLSELPAGAEEERSPGAEPAAVRALLACGHAFHTDCIGRWLLLHPECPLCRCPVLLAGGHQAAARAAVAAPTPAPAWARPARIACGFGDGRVVWTRSPSARQ